MEINLLHFEKECYMTGNNRKSQDIKDEDRFALNPLSSVISRESVKKALDFYESYHRNPINQKIHTVCIPLLVWTVMVWLSGVPFPLTENMANLLAIGYCIGYSLYDLKWGATSAGFLLLFSYTAGLFAENVPHANLLALVFHAAAWAAQLYGHAKFEGNRPALFDSLLSALYIAPLFSLIEASDFLGIKKSPFAANSVFNQNRTGASPSVKEIAENDNNPRPG